MNKYNPNIHHRHSIRLKNYDYSQAGAYFITICCQDKICRFGEIIDDKMVLNFNGKIAYDEWLNLPERFNNVALDYFQIMPNHIHGILILTTPLVYECDEIDNRETENRATENCATENRATARVAPTCVQCTNVGATLAVAHDNMITQNNTIAQKQNATIGNIVGAYKSLVMNKCLELYEKRDETMGKFWQRNYFEHIIRNKEAYENITEYIIKNPERWQNDDYYNI